MICCCSCLQPPTSGQCYVCCYRKGAKYIVQEASRGINEAQRGEQPRMFMHSVLRWQLHETWVGAVP
mgnify:CR=1 FL=1